MGTRQRKGKDWFDAAGEEDMEEVSQDWGEEVVEPFVGGDNDSDTEKLKEFLREDSVGDYKRDDGGSGTSSRGGFGLPSVDLDVFGSSSKKDKTGTEATKGRPRTGRRAKAQAQASSPKATSARKPLGTGGSTKKMEDSSAIPDRQNQNPTSQAAGQPKAGAFVTNSLYISPTKSSEDIAFEEESQREERGGLSPHPSLQAIKSTSSVTGEWSLDMDQMLPDSSKLGAAGNEKGRWREREREATSKSPSVATSGQGKKGAGTKQQQKQEKLPSLKSSSMSPKMTVSTGYQPSFMTRAIEIEDSKSGAEVSESIGGEYSEDFESSRSSLSPMRFNSSETGADEVQSRQMGSSSFKIKSPRFAASTSSYEPTRLEQKKTEVETQSPQRSFPALSPKGRKDANVPVAGKGAEVTSTPSPKKGRKKHSSDSDTPSKVQRSVEKIETSNLRSKLSDLETELQSLKLRNQELLSEKEMNMNNLQAKIQNKKTEKELEDVKASLRSTQEEGKRLKAAFEAKAKAERDLASHCRELEENLISVKEELREKEELSKSIESFNSIQNARKLLSFQGKEMDSFDEFHPVINEFLEEIKNTLDDERSTLKREQSRLDKLVSSVNQDKQSASQQISDAQNKERELTMMQAALQKEKEKMEQELRNERDQMRSQTEAERTRLSEQIRKERQALTDQMNADRDRMNADRDKMTFEKEGLERSIRQLKGEEELLQSKIKRLDDEISLQSKKVNEEKALVDQMRASVEEEKYQLQKQRQEIDADKLRVSEDLAHVRRIKDDIERQTRSITEDKALVNSERQILAKISSEVNEKQMLMAKEKQDLAGTRDSVEQSMEKLAAERVEIAYQLKVLTDERLKASRAAKEAREAELKLRSSMSQQRSKRKQTRTTQGWMKRQSSSAPPSNTLTSGLRMHLLMAELERERKTISHDKKRSDTSLEMQEKFLREAKAQLVKHYHSNTLDAAVWKVEPEKAESNHADLHKSVDQEMSETRLHPAESSFTENFTDLTQLSSEESEVHQVQ